MPDLWSLTLVLDEVPLFNQGQRSEPSVFRGEGQVRRRWSLLNSSHVDGPIELKLSLESRPSEWGTNASERMREKRNFTNKAEISGLGLSALITRFGRVWH